MTCNDRLIKAVKELITLVPPMLLKRPTWRATIKINTNHKINITTLTKLLYKTFTLSSERSTVIKM